MGTCFGGDMEDMIIMVTFSLAINFRDGRREPAAP